MMRFRPLALPAFLAIFFLGAGAAAQHVPAPAGVDAAHARRDMARAQAEGAAARRRAEKLEAQARTVTQQAERTAREAAALAARIQQTEADIAAQEAKVKLIATARDDLRGRLAERQAPLVRLTASLQRLSRRPPVLALFRPGSVRDAIYMRALLETMLPQVERRTASLRADLATGRALEQSALLAAQELRKREAQLNGRRRGLAALEARQRLASREATGIASREADRALALAEKARDLGALVGEIGRQGELRDALARLPGPVMRPPRPEQARVVEAQSFVAPPEGLPTWILPLTGRLVRGFGEEQAGQARTRGLILAARPGAQAVAPAPGRIAFAGPYRGYGRIVIVEHAGRWASLVTGLARIEVSVGEQVLAGSPLGTAGPGSPQVGVELRRNGEPVNPLQYLRTL